MHLHIGDCSVLSQVGPGRSGHVTSHCSDPSRLGTGFLVLDPGSKCANFLTVEVCWLAVFVLPSSESKASVSILFSTENINKTLVTCLY